ncbi:hypothetical protein GF324_11840, partial [bacterium]|nr:hypothetical protein [bacterium]
VGEMDSPLIQGDDISGELGSVVNETGLLADAFSRLTGPEDEDTVFWYEIPTNPQYPVRLYGAPIDVGYILAETFYPKLEAAVFTSATLAVDEKFDFIAFRLGVEEDYRGELYPSPFDMRRQLYIAVAEFTGTPKGDLARYTREVADLVQKLTRDSDAGTLALFTSRRMLREAYDVVKEPLERDGWMVLGQTLDGGQADLLERFKLTRRSVLFGIDSFWEGIDVPGEALEQLVIARLPFAVPTEPLNQARCEIIEEDGGNPFIEYSVPEAALKLKQGIGRLIRTMDDVGVAVICDARVVRSRWGKMILNSLPVPAVSYKDYEHLAEDVRKFLRG